MDAPRKPDPYTVDTGAKPAPRASAGPDQTSLFSSRVEDGVHVITFTKADVVDAYFIEQLGDGIYHHLKGVEAPRVVVDLIDVKHLSSAALGMLIALNTVVGKHNGRICIANVSDDLMMVFKLTKLHKLIKIHNSTEKAVKSLG